MDDLAFSAGLFSGLPSDCVLAIDLEPRLLMQRAILVADQQMCQPLTFVNKQSHGFHFRRQIENNISRVGLARPQRHRQPCAGALSGLERALTLRKRRVFVTALINQG